MDHALRSHGSGKWSAKYGYGFNRPSRIKGHEAWDADSAPTYSEGSIYLLKLHGSLNWQLPSPDSEDAESRPIKLKQRLYQQNGTPRFTIVPPESTKNIDTDPNFRILWKKAERAIRTARSIALVGFSFTPTDLHVEALFRVALAKPAQLETLIIANPNPDHRRRIRNVFTKPLSENCLVRQYNDVEDFATRLDQDVW